MESTVRKGWIGPGTKKCKNMIGFRGLDTKTTSCGTQNFC